MKKNRKYIEIVRAADKKLSSMGDESCSAVVQVLSKHFTHVGVTMLSDASDLNQLLAKKPDVVFLGVKFIPIDSKQEINTSNILWLSDFLDENHIAYTGSNKVAHELESNKPLAKKRMLEYDLKTSPFTVVEQTESLASITNTLTFPVFIKPTNLGGGRGIDSDSLVDTPSQLHKKVTSIHDNHNSGALIEGYLPGREFSVAVLRNEFTNGFTVMPIELIAPPDSNGNRILGKLVKSSNTEQAVLVERGALKTELMTLALHAFLALGARDYGRIDIRLDEDGVPNFLEANLIPSLVSGYGSFPKACLQNISLGHESMIMRIAMMGLSRAD